MPLLLVDDRDGRVMAELESHEQALRLLERLASDESETAAYRCIVALQDRPGALVASESSVTIRPLRGS
jgi:hypothetical protein